MFVVVRLQWVPDTVPNRIRNFEDAAKTGRIGRNLEGLDGINTVDDTLAIDPVGKLASISLQDYCFTHHHFRRPRFSLLHAEEFRACPCKCPLGCFIVTFI